MEQTQKNNEWSVHFKDKQQEKLTIFAESFEKWWHSESCVWYWKFSDGSVVIHDAVLAITNETPIDIPPMDVNSQDRIRLLEATLKLIAEPERQNEYTPRQLARHALRIEPLPK